MGRKRKELKDQESTTAVLRPEAKPELVEASVKDGDVGYDEKGRVTSDARLMVAEKLRDQYWIMHIGAELFNPKLHSLKSTQTFNKPRRVPEDCFRDYLEYLKTGLESHYRNADKKDILA